MDFQKINEELGDTRPITFLNKVLNQPTELDPFFIFSQEIEATFEKNVAYLLADETISNQELLSWKKKNFLVVAQTIDGDYIAGTEEQTLIIPASLYKSDIETFDMTLGDFFTHYTDGTLPSKILPKN